MMPFQALLAAEHIAEMQREAAAARRAREAFASDDPRPPRGTDSRRALARAAVRLSQIAGNAAQRLDPAIEDSLGARRTAGAAGR